MAHPAVPNESDGLNNLPAELLPDGESGKPFCEALKGKAEGRPGSEQALAAATQRFAIAARELAVPPERVLIALKVLLRQACSVPFHLDQDADRKLLSQLVTWCVKAYFGS